MRSAVISLGSKSSLMVIEAMKRYFSVVDIIDIRDVEIDLGQVARSTEPALILCKGKPLQQYDCIYAKGSFRYSQLLRSITTIARKTSYMPIEPAAFSLGHDKLLTQLKLEEAGIPMPATYLAATTRAAKKILAEITYPIIMKFPEGTQGVGVMYADSFASANSILDALAALRQPFVIQEYIDTGGTDIRVLVVGDSVCAAMRRTSGEGEKRANIHSGGTGSAIEIDASLKKISIAAAKAIGADVCAVDILESPRGPLVIEVNLSPGLQGITAAVSIDIPDKIAKFLFEQTNKWLAQSRQDTAQQILRDFGISKTGEARIGSSRAPQSLAIPPTQDHIISTLNLRNRKIVLPALVTDISKFEEGEEIEIEAARGRITIKRSEG